MGMKKRTGRRKREEMSSSSSKNSQGTSEPKRIGNTRQMADVPEQEKEDTEEIMLNLAKRLNVNLEPEDIDIAHRMKKGILNLGRL